MALITISNAGITLLHAAQLPVAPNNLKITLALHEYYYYRVGDYGYGDGGGAGFVRLKYTASTHTSLLTHTYASVCAPVIQNAGVV